MIQAKIIGVIGIISLITIAALSGVIKYQHVRLLNKDQTIASLKQEIKDWRKSTEICHQQQEINYEASNAFQKENATLRRDNARIKRLLSNVPDQCIPIQQAPSGSDAGTPGRLSGNRGVMAPALVDLATSCDEISAQLRALQGWVQRSTPR